MGGEGLCTSSQTSHCKLMPSSQQWYGKQFRIQNFRPNKTLGDSKMDHTYVKIYI